MQLKGSFTKMEIDPRYYFIGRIKLESDAFLDVDFLQLSGFRYLWYLSLKSKTLRFKHINSFYRLKNLKQLELYDPTKFIVEQLDFEKLLKLKSLEISYTNLTRFYIRNLKKAINITSLTLQNVILKTEDIDSFANFTKLKNLKISKSKLESLSFPGLLPKTLQSLILVKIEDTIYIDEHKNCSIVASDCSLRISSNYDVMKGKLDVTDSLVTMESCEGDRGNLLLNNSFVRFLDSNCRSQCFVEP